jgi:dTDP-4-dehydrorhamnose 3,5-epimerase
MRVEHFGIAGPFAFTAPRHGDARGYFTETFNLSQLRQHGLVENDWVQDNQSLSVETHTLRGMHFQLPPFAQAKIVRVVAGRIFDVAVDLRAQSPTYGKWIGVELSSDTGNQLYVPLGFAHGFLTQEPNTVVAYKVSNNYSKTHDRCLNWADADVAIAWPLPKPATPMLSDKDRNAPMLRSLAVELKEFA